MMRNEEKGKDMCDGVDPEKCQELLQRYGGHDESTRSSGTSHPCEDPGLSKEEKPICQQMMRNGEKGKDTCDGVDPEKCQELLQRYGGPPTFHPCEDPGLSKEEKPI